MHEGNAGADSPLAPIATPGAPTATTKEGVQEASLAKTGSAVESLRTRSVELTVLVVLAVFYTFYFAREFLLPIAFALLLDFLFSPVIRVLARWRIPAPVSAGLVIILLVGFTVLGVYRLAGPVQKWSAQAPATLATAQNKMRGLLKPFERVTKTAEQVESAATGVAGEKSAPEVVIREQSIGARVFGSTQKFLAAALEVLVLLYFLLAAGDLFLQKLIKVLPNLRDKRKAVEIARATEASISTYLVTAAMMNVVEGAVVAIAMHLLGMPNALLWGVMAALLEFIPYLGALAMVIILTVAGLTVFDGVAQALLVPVVFLVINLVQANFLSPMLLGHRLALNPVALFVGLAFWFWIWGIPGAFIAVPLMAAFKILCDHVEALAPVGEFLGMKDDRKAVT